MTPVRMTALGGVLVLLATLFQLPAHAEQARFDDRVSGEPVRILPLGDSITHGTAGDWTWRYFLDRHLRAVGQPFDLVGPQREVHDLTGRGWDPVYADPEFDQDHAAWWGNSLAWRVDPGPVALVTDHEPDVVLMAANASDIGFWNRTPDQALALVERWVETAREVDPSLAFVLVEVPLTHRDVYEPYNRMLGSFAAEISTTRSPVVVAEAAKGYRSSAGFSDGGDTWDQQHPNAQGSQKIAAAVADALAQLGVGVPHVRPLRRVTEGPTEVPELELLPDADRDDGSVGFRWSAVSGASAVQLEQRVGQGPWTAAVPRVDTLDSWGTRVEGLEECVTHEFRARAVKVWTIASERFASSEVTYRWSGEISHAPEVFAQARGHRIVLTWPTVPNACAVTVEVTRSVAGRNTSVRHGEAHADRYFLRAPVAGEDVEVRVVPLGAREPGPVARLSFSGPRPWKLARVTGLKVLARKRKVVRLRWSDVAGEHGYRIRVARGTGKWKVAKRLGADVRRARITGLRPGTRHRIQVRALAKDRPAGRWSRTVTVRTRR